MPGERRDARAEGGKKQNRQAPTCIAIACTLSALPRQKVLEVEISTFRMSKCQLQTDEKAPGFNTLRV